MKMFRSFCLVLICIMHTLHAMNNEEIISSLETKTLSSISSLMSLKQSCFKALTKQEPQKVKELFLKKAIPGDLLYEFADKIADNPSYDYVSDFAEILPLQTYPHIFLRNITWENVPERQNRVEKIGSRLLALAHEKKDNATTGILEVMKKIVEDNPQFFYTTESNSNNIKKALFYGALEIGPSLDVVLLLLKKGCSLQHYQFMDCLNDLNLFEGHSVIKLAQLREKYLQDENIFMLREFAQKNNLNNLLAQDIEKIALGLTFSIRVNRILASSHKILHLGLFNAYFTQFKSMSGIIIYILNRLCELNNDWSFDDDYARFKNEWDKNKYFKENLKYREQIKQFHIDRTKKLFISPSIQDKRYCKDLPLFRLMMSQKRNFYISMLKLLSFYCPIEFEKNKKEFLWRLSIPTEKVDAFINENSLSSYDIEKHTQEWQKNN